MLMEIVLFRYMLRSINPCNNSLLRDVPKVEYIEKTTTINNTKEESEENLPAAA
ncbi:MAG: hypothetical protein SWH78_16090 [Thermodesulfobacteriota bacterium]|nr:hypothetical protein [Thermodesulfobacteriota bacterium]